MRQVSDRMSVPYKPGGYIAPVYDGRYERPFRHPLYDLQPPGEAITATSKLDPRWEWHEISTYSQPGPSYVRGLCKHREVVPVESVGGEVVAHLCTTCDQQLPEEWSA